MKPLIIEELRAEANEILSSMAAHEAETQAWARRRVALLERAANMIEAVWLATDDSQFQSAHIFAVDANVRAALIEPAAKETPQ